jgi:RNA polymerase sigma-70 factor (ECF subfamily)
MCSRRASADEENVYPGETSPHSTRRAEKKAPSPAGGIESTNAEDAILAANLARGQDDAMQILFERYQDGVFRIARRWLGDHGESKDMVQEVFKEAFKDIAAFDLRRGSFKTWLLTIAHNRTINRKHYLEAKGFYKSTPLQGQLLDHATDIGLDRLGLLPQERSHLTTELLARLESRERHTITSIYQLGLTRKQVADELGVTIAAVRHSLKKGLKILYSAITEGGHTRTARNDSKGKDACGD